VPAVLLMFAKSSVEQEIARTGETERRTRQPGKTAMGWPRESADNLPEFSENPEVFLRMGVLDSRHIRYGFPAVPRSPFPVHLSEA
jgi:hypothetical protein